MILGNLLQRFHLSQQLSTMSTANDTKKSYDTQWEKEKQILAKIKDVNTVSKDPFYEGILIGEYRNELPCLFKDFIVNLNNINKKTDDSYNFLDSLIMSAEDLEEEQEIKELLISYGVYPDLISFSYRT